MSIGIIADGFSISKNNGERDGSQKKVSGEQTKLLKIRYQKFQFQYQFNLNIRPVKPIKHFSLKGESNIITQHMLPTKIINIMKIVN